MERQAAALYFAVLRTQYEAEMTAAKKSATKPLTCPFCGTAAEVHNGYPDVRVLCPNRRCPARPSVKWYPRRSRAIAAWNRRAK